MAQVNTERMLIGRVILLLAGIATLLSPGFLQTYSEWLEAGNPSSPEIRWMSAVMSLIPLISGMAFINVGLRPKNQGNIVIWFGVCSIAFSVIGMKNGIVHAFVLIPGISALFALGGMALIASSNGNLRQWLTSGNAY